MYSHGVCFMPLTLNLSGQMGSAQIYKNSNKKKKKRETVAVESKKQPKTAKTQKWLPSPVV